MRMSVKLGAVLTAASSILLVGPGLAGAQASKGELAPTAKGQTKPKEAHGGGARPSRSPNMTNHGGPIMPSSIVQPIFWGTSWSTYTGDKKTGIESFYTGFSGSNYAKTSDEYSGTNGQVGPTNTVVTSDVEPSQASSDSSGQITFNEVVKEMNAGHVATPTGNNNYYPVY